MFGYDAAGKKAAAKEAKKTGQPMQTTYKKGGKIKVRGTGAATKGLYARGPMA